MTKQELIDFLMAQPPDLLAEVIGEVFLSPVEMAGATNTSESQWRNKAASGQVDGALKKGKQWLIPRAAND